MSENNTDRKDMMGRLLILSSLVRRAQLAARTGMEYGGDRNVYQALGYPTNVRYNDFLARYERQDISTAIIDKPVNATWQGGVGIEETGVENSQLKEQWKNLCQNKTLKVIPTLSRFDKLIGLGEFAILLFGFSDVATPSDFQKPVSGNVNLVYLKPFGQGDVSIKIWDTNTASPRYGMPVMYEVALDSVGGNVENSLLVHYTRVLHVADNVLTGTVKGRSRLLPVYNRLIDLEKLVGGSAEMFWRGARPGYRGKLDSNFTITKEEEDELEAQLDEYEHNLRRFLINKGVDVSAMEMQVADPKSHVDVQIQMISAQTGIPKRILTGSERGELASTEDLEAWYTLIDNRRTGFVEGEILRPFVDKCIEVGVLPQPAGKNQRYNFVWKPLFEQSDGDKAKVGETRASALNKYAAQPMAENIVPPDAFYKYFLGFTDDQVESIKNIKESAMTEESEE